MAALDDVETLGVVGGLALLAYFIWKTVSAPLTTNVASGIANYASSGLDEVLKGKFGVLATAAVAAVPALPGVSPYSDSDVIPGTGVTVGQLRMAGYSENEINQYIAASAQAVYSAGQQGTDITQGFLNPGGS